MENEEVKKFHENIEVFANNLTVTINNKNNKDFVVDFAKLNRSYTMRPGNERNLQESISNPVAYERGSYEYILDENLTIPANGSQTLNFIDFVDFMDFKTRFNPYQTKVKDIYLQGYFEKSENMVILKFKI